MKTPEQPAAVPSLHVPARPSPLHILDNGAWREMTAGEAVYLAGHRLELK